MLQREVKALVRYEKSFANPQQWKNLENFLEYDLHAVLLEVLKEAAPTHAVQAAHGWGSSTT
jgi:hypothetical protein